MTYDVLWILTLLLPATPLGPPSVRAAAPPVDTGSDAVRASTSNPPPQPAGTDRSLSTLPIWDDGLAEMAYYRAIDRIYGELREYTRVVLLNRQWMDPVSVVKAEQITNEAVPVFKLNVVEQIPTANYNYRFQTTVFLTRPNLTPLKMAVSSQEWCGTTFKHLLWSDAGVTVKSFSYFPNEGDHTWKTETDAVPYEALLVMARDVAADGRARTLDILAPMRSNHEVMPTVTAARLIPRPATGVIVAAGRYKARRIDVEWDGPLTGFLVESDPPYRLLRYQAGPARGELLHVERRAYWDQDSNSAFYKQGQAP